MSDSYKNDLFGEPNLHHQKLGQNLSIETVFRNVKEFPGSSVAMSAVACAEYKDQLAKEGIGLDDFTLSLERLFNAFDVFIEEITNGAKKAGCKDNYDLDDPYELTVFLIWQIRHLWTHSGRLVDNKCKRRYEKTISKKLNRGIRPYLPLPETIQVNREFKINYDNYSKIKECIFKFIERRIPKNATDLLYHRSYLTNLTWKGITLEITLANWDVLSFNLQDALEAGVEIDFKNRCSKTLDTAKYDAEQQRIILQNGKSFPANLRPTPHPRS